MNAFSIPTSHVQLFENKPNAIPTFGIRHRESIEILAIEPDAIANFQYPDTPPWTYTPLNVNLTLAKSKKDTTNPIEFIDRYYEIKGKYRGYNSIYTDHKVITQLLQ